MVTVSSLPDGQAFKPRLTGAEREARFQAVRQRGTLRIALVGLAFPVSFFGDEHFLNLVSSRPMGQTLTGALPLLAALVPQEHTVEIFDGNVTPLDIEHLKTFDIIGVTGMIVQRHAFIDVLKQLADHDGLVLVGGSYASVDPTFFDELCDVIFIGEADETWPAFFDHLRDGEPIKPVQIQAERTDMSTLPLPRYDLIDPKSYIFASVQFSRGCPFMCEFCDIITIFGRKPRTKTPEMMLAELDSLVERGFKIVFLIDDNFIGNKKLAREFLIRLVEWQEENGYPLRFSTEASLNLADEPELLDLMARANFGLVFIGIESANPESLAETRKVQNLRGDSQIAKLSRIREAGLIVIAGFIVGFDSDDSRIFETQRAFIEEANIAVAAVGTLTAIPSTPLYDRLKAAGRLRYDDPLCNLEPAQMTAEELRSGYLDLVETLYTPEAYFGRLMRNIAELKRPRETQERLVAAGNPVTLKQRAEMFARLGGLVSRFVVTLVRQGEFTNLVPRYWRVYRDIRRDAAAPMSLDKFLFYAAHHWHYFKFYKDMRIRPSATFEYAHNPANRIDQAAVPERVADPVA